MATRPDVSPAGRAHLKPFVIVALLTLLLRPKDLIGGRGDGNAPGWRYECKQGHGVTYPSKQRITPVCLRDGNPMSLVRKP
jgi:hypothetical protein